MLFCAAGPPVTESTALFYSNIETEIFPYLISGFAGYVTEEVQYPMWSWHPLQKFIFIAEQQWSRVHREPPNTDIFQSCWLLLQCWKQNYTVENYISVEWSKMFWANENEHVSCWTEKLCCRIDLLVVKREQVLSHICCYGNITIGQ